MDCIFFFSVCPLQTVTKLSGKEQNANKPLPSLWRDNSSDDDWNLRLTRGAGRKLKVSPACARPGQALSCPLFASVNLPVFLAGAGSRACFGGPLLWAHWIPGSTWLIAMTMGVWGLPTQALPPPPVRKQCLVPRGC